MFINLKRTAILEDTRVNSVNEPFFRYREINSYLELRPKNNCRIAIGTISIREILRRLRSGRKSKLPRCSDTIN